MASKHQKTLAVSCRCGEVAFEAADAPIMTVACHCESCQEAGRRIAEMPGALPTVSPDGGTDFALYRKDRIRCVQGGGRLVEHRLKPDSPTRRMVAGCCNSAMFLEFKGGHWLSVYRGRLPEGAAPVEMRVMTGDQRDGIALPDDVPSYASHSGRFMWKLLGAWVAMGFRVPKVEGVPA